MASPLSEMRIGSPLPDSKELIAKQLRDGTIEFLSGVDALDALSTVTLRSASEIGLDVLNGTWCFSPKYMYETRHPVSYTFGHTQAKEIGGYSDLLHTMVQKAAQEFYYGPLGLIRKFLIQHEAQTGKTDLLLPQEWSVVIDDNLKMQDFLGVIEGYVRGNARQAVAAAVYEQFYSDTQNPTRPVRLVYKRSGVWIYPADDTKIRGRGQFDMTPIIRFISNPRGHGLNQEIFKAYRALVNL
ncbi:hypothetical protein pEaSNUABM22_00072 [Erwinia phage pEa_SNUABM_22]|uniref:Uncharacterized protein n=2 Tax=Alexandravirus TaxID=2733088 RepID=A0AAE8XR29_9CAUD|nr:hypothetical protein MPK63_gp072 [Erwinia phage pEa_SNUABM_22]YP_010299833.1 hypothetical protein MPK64_gp072 [Erwinia phage pEa_SNUABM_16]QZE58975.1 hypothetical protein pEaSNUABM18_00072 [Erwinia phage pEa_SNUABM_18]UAW96216.1 hypothetical protein pEaSNUABM16_00072 [Erwinia phage pEa_SNUABM_16]UAW96560.1 hypothetical protein pEaSNUABM22_00072 [Erwinia phage pEa_SNUABM_22]